MKNAYKLYILTRRRKPPSDSDAPPWKKIIGINRNANSYFLINFAAWIGYRLFS